MTRPLADRQAQGSDGYIIPEPTAMETVQASLQLMGQRLIEAVQAIGMAFQQLAAGTTEALGGLDPLIALDDYLPWHRRWPREIAYRWRTRTDDLNT